MNPEATGKVLVTGGVGFLDSQLCERLVSDGRDVVCVDNLYTGSKKSVEHLFNSPRFEFIHHDVQTPLHLEVEQIFNVACPASPAWFMADPVFTASTSLLGAINLLDLAKAQSARILKPLLQKFTAIQKVTLKTRITGEMSILLVPEPATTRVRDVLKHFSLTIFAISKWILESSASSILIVRVCIGKTVVWLVTL